MKTYRVTVKHDKGTVKMVVSQESEWDAISQVCKAEGCPWSAVQKVELLPLYVTMTDKFMSGWGMAAGKTNKFIVVCESWEQAEAVHRAAKHRPEMRHVSITDKKPRDRANVLLSWKKFDELGEIWKR